MKSWRRKGFREQQEPSISYEDLFILLSGSVERWMIRLAKALVIMLAAVQLLLLHPAARHFLVPVEKLEGRPLDGFPTH